MSTPRPATLNASAAALFFNNEGSALIVNPTYKDHWNLPGGGVEIGLGETPYDAAVREVREEIGITPPIGRLLVTAWLSLGTKGAQLLYIFDGGVLSAEDEAAITLQESELSEYRFCPPHGLEPGLMPPHLTEVWQAALAARSECRTEFVSVRL
ncbi:NUDIX hydrolase [Streptomyces phaeolivaceus]|uniref:NUDIX hydrolase n=1 Tax=Streptomyces phaeolivaceus TaxID=2653200 RepID=A0A5P8K2P8_9ACTN|nr:NUDIX hydrolase [Streptomyces phaeolivaceus]QFQ97306.1 NUDIX hydrolase [Streptomyces phaeolivaceus]